METKFQRHSKKYSVSLSVATELNYSIFCGVPIA